MPQWSQVFARPKTIAIVVGTMIVLGWWLMPTTIGPPPKQLMPESTTAPSIRKKDRGGVRTDTEVSPSSEEITDKATTYVTTNGVVVTDFRSGKRKPIDDIPAPKPVAPFRIPDDTAAELRAQVVTLLKNCVAKARVTEADLASRVIARATIHVEGQRLTIIDSGIDNSPFSEDSSQVADCFGSRIVEIEFDTRSLNHTTSHQVTFPIVMTDILK